MYKGMKRVAACLLALLLMVFALPAFAEDEPPRIPPGDLAPAGAALPGEGKYDVYAGPGETYLRPADGKATVSAKGWVLTFGTEDGWTLIAYQVGNDQYRFGWIKGEAAAKELAFERVPATIRWERPLTDDSLGKQAELAFLKEGTAVTRLAKMGIWAYVETEIDGVKARGFVEKDALQYADTEIQYEDCLYPIRENGKWGYMNYRGETVLEPQWASAGAFRGAGYAVAVKWMDDEAEESIYLDGIIDRTGAYVVKPEYLCSEGQDGYYFGGKDTGVIWLDCENEPDGFFDVASGCFSGKMNNTYFCWVNGERLITVLSPYEESEWWNCVGFADRTTGKLVIPYQYAMVEGTHFDEGFAYVERYDPKTEILTPLIINEQNEALPLPKGIIPLEHPSFSEGLLVVKDTKTGLFGYADTAGKLVIPAKYEEEESFYKGIAKVRLNGETRYIDTAGRLADPPGEDRYHIRLGSGEVTLFFEGYQNADGLCGVMDGNGNILVPLETGYYFDESYDYGYDIYFKEGLQVLIKDGKYGFLDEKGNEAIPFVWDYAENFGNGLAWVVKDGKRAYIDHSGNVVWQEE